MTAVLAQTLCEATLEFVRYVDQRLKTVWLNAARQDPQALDALFSGAVEDIHKRLAPGGQREPLSHMPSWVVQRFHYFLAAWADEYMIRALGEKLPTRAIGAIEARTFGTREAGERVFALIDNLLAEQGEAAEALLPAVNWIFALGFTGQYGDENQASELRAYRDRIAIYAFAARSPQATEPIALKIPVGRSHRVSLLLLATAACWLIAICMCSLYFSQTVKWDEPEVSLAAVTPDPPTQAAFSAASVELTPRTPAIPADKRQADKRDSGANRPAAETR